MAPILLIASPQSQDPLFGKTVVLVWEHDEQHAVGVVINRPLQHSLPEVLDLDDDIDMAPYLDSVVGWGGPVDTGVGTVVTPADIRDDEGWTLSCGLSITRSQDALVRLLHRQAPVFLVLGYAGWGAGQLDDEIRQGAWIVSECDPALVLDVAPEDRYERALAAVGLTTRSIWMQPVDE